MKKFTKAATAAAAGAALLLTAGCSARTDAGTGEESTAGFAADAVIGVALPAKTSENWVLAGDLFVSGLTEAGFQADVQYAAATGTVASQQEQIEALVTKGAKVIIIGAEDGSQLSAQVKTAKDAGAIVIAYDRLIMNTDAVDYYIAFDNFNVGVKQAESLLEGLEAKKPGGPWNIELFSGALTDSNSGVFFQGAMSILQPRIDAGDLVVVSGQVTQQQTATEGWSAENAQTRMDSLLVSHYKDKDIDGVLSPNDNLARAIITSAQNAGKALPVVTGQDSEEESVRWVVDGRQYSTINKDTRKLVAKVIESVKQLQTGATLEVNDTTSYNNGVKVVPAYLLAPIAVTKANAAEAYADDPKLGPIARGEK